MITHMDLFSNILYHTMIISLPLCIITWGLILIWLFDFGDRDIIYRIMDKVNNYIRLPILWGVIMFVFLTSFIGLLIHGKYQDANLKQIDSIIHVEGNKVTIDKLLKDYKYKNLNDDRFGNEDKDVLNDEEKQVLVFEEDNTYNVNYLIDKNGRKYELNEEDTKFLKERGVQ